MKLFIRVVVNALVEVSARCRRRRFTTPICAFCCTILLLLLLLLLQCAPLYERRLVLWFFTTSVAKTVLFFFRSFNYCRSYNASAADRGVSNSHFVHRRHYKCNKSVPIFTLQIYVKASSSQTCLMVIAFILSEIRNFGADILSTRHTDFAGFYI